MVSTDDDPLTAELDSLRSRHRKIRLPGTGEEICESDRHKWPCHAHRALAALDLVLKELAPYVARTVHDRLVAILAGEEAPGGQ